MELGVTVRVGLEEGGVGKENEREERLKMRAQDRG